ncbi:MAG TPA: TlpA disulfide reductase family protein [Blastocatellia bacterium]|nr:TlpA disulfide reductase family protein [Blastocatellia bacterium]
MKFLLILMASIVLAAPALFIQTGNAAASAPQEPALKPLPALTLSDLDGKAVAPEGFKGSILVLDFWATWCGPCIVEIPAYNKLQEKYANKGVKFVGVTMASGESKEVKPFVERHRMKYTILLGDDAQAYDFNIIGFPTTYLVTRDGKIFAKYVGAGPAKLTRLESDIQKLLADSSQ